MDHITLHSIQVSAAELHKVTMPSVHTPRARQHLQCTRLTWTCEASHIEAAFKMLDQASDIVMTFSYCTSCPQ